MTDPIRDYVRGFRTTPQEQTDVPSVAAGLGAAIRTETSVSALRPSSSARRNFSPFRADDAALEGYDPLANLPTKYRPYQDRFTDIRTPEDDAALRRQLDDEIRDRDILGKFGPVSEFGLIAGAQLFDPINLVGGSAIKGPTLGARMRQGAVAAGVGTVLQEPILQATQETRTETEGAFNLGASVIFGSLLGAGVHALSPQVKQDIAASDLNNVVPLKPIEAEAMRVADDEDFLRSIGAAERPPVTEGDLEITSAAQRAAIAATPRVLGPTVGLIKSPSTTAKALGSDLAENQFQIAGVESGAVGQSAETAIKVTAGRYEILKERTLQDGFREFIAETNGPSRLRPFQRYRANRDYSERMAQALRNDDIDPNSVAITRAAQKIRREVLDPIGEAAFGGKLPTKTALSYFTRSWNRQALGARQVEFLQIVGDYFANGIRHQGITKRDLAQSKLSEAEGRLQAETIDTGTGAPSNVQLDMARKELNDLERMAGNFPKYPVSKYLAKTGGIDPDGALARELRGQGIDLRKYPGLLKKGGRGDVDNIDADAFGYGDAITRGPDGYLERQDMIDAIVDEFSQSPRRTAEQLVILDEIERLSADLQGVRGEGIGKRDMDALTAEIEQLRQDAARRDDELADLTDDEIKFYSDEAARGVWATLTGNDQGVENPMVAVMQGPLKGRTLLIPDERVKQFLNNDAFEVLGQYIRTMSAEVELKKRYGRADMRDQIADIDIEYDELVANAPNEKESARLNRERIRDKKAVEGLRDILRGTYLAKEHGSGAAAAARSVMAYNFVSKLGDLVASAIPDVMRLAQVHGATEIIGPQGVAAVAKSIKAVAADPKVGDYLKAEVEAAGISEILLNSRVQGMTDLYDPYAGRGPIESWTNSTANAGANLAGANIWNQHWKQVAFQLGINRFYRMAGEGWDNLKPRDRKYLTSLKVSKADFARISEALNANGIKDGLLVDPRTAEWADIHAAETFRRALRSDADSIIVTPGAGDKPLIARHPLAAIPFQFQSFFLAAQNRALIRGLGEDQTHFLTGSALMIAMGMATYQMKAITGNFDTPDFEDDPGNWIGEGIDRSGVIPLVMQINNAQEPFTGVGIVGGLSEAFGGAGETASRYRFRRQNFLLDTVLGPTGGTIKDAFRVGSDAVRGDIKEGTVGAGFRLLPFANHPGVKQFFRYWAIPEAKDAVN